MKTVFAAFGFIGAIIMASPAFAVSAGTVATDSVSRGVSANYVGANNTTSSTWR